MMVYPEVDFRRLPGPLAALFGAAAEHSYFAQSEWFDLMARFALEPDTRVMLYANDDAALVCRTDGEGKLHSLTNAYSLEHGPVLREGGAAALARLVAAVAAERPAVQAIRFTALDRDEAGSRALEDAFGAVGWLVKPFFDSGTWYEDTRGMSFAQYVEARPPALKNTARRKGKSAAQHGVAYVFEDEEDIETLIAEYEAIYRQSWKREERFPAFMPELIRMASRQGALRMGVARVAGEPAAAQFWLLWHGRAVIYKLAHDERFDKLSVGTLLTMRMTERVLERDRPDEINLGRGDDPYKQTWLPRRRERWGFVAANPRTFEGAKQGLRIIAGRIRDRVVTPALAAAKRGR